LESDNRTQEEEGGIMVLERVKKVALSLALAGAFILSSGFAAASVASAQDRDDWHRRYNRQSEWDRRREHEEMERIRRYDRDRQLRYRMNNSIRVVGYYDRFGRFHAQGFFDRFGRFHRY
jgi:hypothetical protein